MIEAYFFFPAIGLWLLCGAYLYEWDSYYNLTTYEISMLVFSSILGPFAILLWGSNLVNNRSS